MKIQLHYVHLLYDVEQHISHYATSRIEAKDKRYEANLRSTDEGEANLLEQWITAGAAKLRASLSGYLEQDGKDSQDVPQGEVTTIDYVFKRTVRADSRLLADAMHQTIVRLAVSAWCDMQGYMGDAQREQAVAEDYERRVKRSIRKTRPVLEGKKDNAI